LIPYKGGKLKSTTNKNSGGKTHEKKEEEEEEENIHERSNSKMIMMKKKKSSLQRRSWSTCPKILHFKFFWVFTKILYTASCSAHCNKTSSQLPAGGTSLYYIISEEQQQPVNSTNLDGTSKAHQCLIMTLPLVYGRFKPPVGRGDLGKSFFFNFFFANNVKNL
jgi:hypothetical protein